MAGTRRQEKMKEQEIALWSTVSESDFFPAFASRNRRRPKNQQFTHVFIILFIYLFIYLIFWQNV